MIAARSARSGAWCDARWRSRCSAPSLGVNPASRWPTSLIVWQFKQSSLNIFAPSRSLAQPIADSASPAAINAGISDLEITSPPIPSGTTATSTTRHRRTTGPKLRKTTAVGMVAGSGSRDLTSVSSGRFPVRGIGLVEIRQRLDALHPRAELRPDSAAHIQIRLLFFHA